MVVVKVVSAFGQKPMEARRAVVVSLSFRTPKTCHCETAEVWHPSNSELAGVAVAVADTVFSTIVVAESEEHRRVAMSTILLVGSGMDDRPCRSSF